MTSTRPPDVTDHGETQAIRSGAANPGPAPVRPSHSKAGNVPLHKFLAKLSAEESAAIRNAAYSRDRNPSRGRPAGEGDRHSESQEPAFRR